LNIKTYTNDLKILQKELSYDIPDEILIALSLDITRVADKKITNHINSFKYKEGIKISTQQKEI
jgi:hypothetical protein